jgi:DNA-binding XRE family transcriptional regulator
MIKIFSCIVSITYICENISFVRKKLNNLLSEQQQKMFYKWLGELLRKARNDNDFTQEKLAKHLNLSRVSIANIEKGKQKVQIHTLIEIAFYLKMSFADLYERALGIMNIHTKIETRIIKEVDPSNITGIEKIKAFINFTSGKGKKQ